MIKIPNKKQRILFFSFFLLFSCSFAYEIKILPADDNKIYFSAYPNFHPSVEPFCSNDNNKEEYCPEDIVTSKKLNEFSKIVPKKLAWAVFDNNWYEGDGIVFPKTKVLTLHEKGIVPVVRMMPRSIGQEELSEKTYTLENITDGVFDTKLKKWANDAKNLKDSKERLIPIMVDFALEMNGDWFQWSRPNNDTNDSRRADWYKNAYRHIIDLFRGEGVKNITWVFHPNIISYPNVTEAPWNSASNYYPGDNYIDWIGVSLYGALDANSWETFSDLFNENIKDLSLIDKPFAIFEFGASEKNDSKVLNAKSKSYWLNDAFETILDINNKNKTNIKIKAINYWHESWEDTNTTPSTKTRLRIDSNLKAKKTFNQWINHNKFISDTKFSEGWIKSISSYSNGMDIFGNFNKENIFEIYLDVDNNNATGNIWGMDYLVSYENQNINTYVYLNNQWIKRDNIVNTLYVDSTNIYINFIANILQENYAYSISTFLPNWNEIDSIYGEYYF